MENKENKVKDENIADAGKGCLGIIIVILAIFTIVFCLISF